MANNRHFSPIDVEILEESDNYAEIVAKPFERGFGVTIGNSLRRVLMTGIPGIAITSVRIEGVAHEFSTVEGIVEDVADIILNLKKVRFKLVEDVGPELVTIHLTGPGHFTGQDITNASESFEVLNPEIKIGTLMDTCDTTFEIRISRGKGYSSAVKNKLKDAPLGTIAMDSIFNPITNVAWDVTDIPTSIENEEQLILKITSDGSTSPKDALNHSSSILRQHLVLFMFDDSELIASVNEEEFNEALEIKSLLVKNIDEMELSVRSYNCLQSAGIKSIGELVAKDEGEMLKFKNFGRKSLNELVEKLESMGLHFGMDVKQYLGEEEF